MNKSFSHFDNNFCSFKWAVFLKECGVRQDTSFHYVVNEKNDKPVLAWSSYNYDGETYAAFTIQEFVELFPKVFTLERGEKKWIMRLANADASMDKDEKLVDVFARILITLTKNKIQPKRIGIQRRRIE